MRNHFIEAVLVAMCLGGAGGICVRPHSQGAAALSG